MEKKNPRIIISGGGTGGHIFPAIAIANAIREIAPEAEILFVGAEGRMEMERVPAAGYKIIGLPVVGLQRRLTIKNLAFPFKLLRSLRIAKKLITTFAPDLAIGVGGYASGPILKAAQKANIPTLIQEQNSYAGITNRLLARNAKIICVAYEGMEKYFPKEKIILTGNPVRQGLENTESKLNEALEFFRLPKGASVVLVTGGSLGAKTINQSILDNINLFAKEAEVYLLWQTGKLYAKEIQEKLKQLNSSRVRAFDFIDRMDLAYAAANIVISRAGAGTISELCIVGKPAILVPSPNVSEDHQTKNALALTRKNAAILVADENATQLLVPESIELINNEEQAAVLSKNIKALALPNAAITIATKGLELCNC
jgi:UDP-N-acetylglucosamine--N-acetylmuramyl-(pentapeptide) pyrophosphoryl-undecaprenol N-acetylglucosamine transferase